MRNLSRKWQPEEDKILRKLYPNTSTAKMVAALNRGKQAITKRAEQLGLERSAQYISRLEKNPKLFTSGRTPWNKRGHDRGNRPITRKLREKEFISTTDRLHGWNMRPEDRPKFREKMAALNQVEQALNAMRNSNVSIS